MPDSLDKLVKLTEKYWGLSETGANKFYMEKSQLSGEPEGRGLLQREVSFAATGKGGRLPTADSRRTTLVILVGESNEPLLQSIQATNPDRLVPLVNKYYQSDKEFFRKTRIGDKPLKGQTKWERLRRLIENLPSELKLFQPLLQEEDGEKDEKKQPEQLPQTVEPVPDEPTPVFEYLQKQLKEDLRDPNHRIIIDITGAKKTMVAGAFLFAAHCDAEIQYIDTLATKNGKPYGFTCNFRAVTNPVKELALDIWQQVEQSYRQHDFVGARRLLQPLIENTAWAVELNRLDCFLSVCHLWDNNQYDKANEELQYLEKLSSILIEHVPTAVPTLSNYWQNTRQQEKVDLDFYSDPEAVLIYAHDELERARHLAGMQDSPVEDSDILPSPNFQAAFTRAYALHETLIKARVFALCYTNQLNEPCSSEIKDKIASNMQTKQCCEVLTGNQAHQLRWDRKSGPEFLPEHLNPYDEHGRGKAFTKMRNAVIHTHFPVSELLAKKALQKAADNLDNYQGEWVSLFANGVDLLRLEKAVQDAIFNVPSWNGIRQDCPLPFIPEKDIKGA